MCIVFFTATAKYSLVLASNRDEFLARPTTRASFHCWSPALDAQTPYPTRDNKVLSGLDLEAGGTWLGLARSPTQLEPANLEQDNGVVRIATLTNFTETVLPRNPPRPSRGHLVRDFLDFKRGESLEDYLKGIEDVKQDYAGFNLLVLELHRLPGDSADRVDHLKVGYCSNRETATKRARVLPSFEPQDPVKGLSNATLEAEPGEEVWPKVTSGCAAVQKAVNDAEESVKPENDLIKELWYILSTASLSEVTHRSHLRHTVLVRPLSISPHSPLPPNPPPLPAPSVPLSPADLPSSLTSGLREGEEGTRWYATRTQTVILVERETGRIIFSEREGYRLEDGRPIWVGDNEPARTFELNL